MKFIKLDNTQAKKLSGRYGNFNAANPRFIGEDFYIMPFGKDLMEIFGIAKRYLKRLASSGKIKIIDMSKATDPDVIKLKSVFKETEAEGDARLATRVTKWDYTTRDITTEL